LNNEPWKILLVEDDEDDYLITRDLLEEIKSQPATLQWVLDPEAALEAMAASAYDVVLMDYRLGEHDGIDVLREAIARGFQDPIILLTGQGGHDIDLEAMAAGAADYLVKGQINAPLLERAIRHVLIREEARKALAGATAFSDHLISSSLDMIIAVDTRRRITEFNPAAEKAFGYAEAEILGQSVERLYAEPEAASRAHNTTVQAGVFQGEILNKRKNGEVFAAYLSSSLLRDADGVVKGIMGVSRDITERKKTEDALRESEKRFREMTQLLPQPVFETDLAGAFTYTNESGLDVFGYTQEDLEKGVNVLELYIPEDRDRVAQNFQKKLGGTEFENHEYTGLRKDRTTFPILVYTAPIMRDKQPHGVRGIVLDITERKHAEEKLRETMAELEYFNKAMVGRELRMIELKREVNVLAERLSETAPYDLSFAVPPEEFQ